MDQKVKEALSRVSARLKSLPKDEFDKEISEHSSSEIAVALMKSYDFSKFCYTSITMEAIKRMIVKARPSSATAHEFEYSKVERLEAANDDQYLLAV